MVKHKPSYWSAQDPHKTSEAMAAILSCDIDRIISDNVSIYDSVDVKIGINKNKLADWADILEAFNTLDPRGGFMKQEEMEMALNSVIENNDKVAAFQAMCSHLGKDATQVRNIIVYKIRVMLAHRRLSKSSAASTSTDTTPNKFFVNFNAEDDQEAEPSEETADKVEVSKYFDGHTFEAIRLFSDGDWLKSRLYSKGPNGMVVAHWDDAELELQVPNACLSDDGTLSRYLPPVVNVVKNKNQKRKSSKAPRLKRPAAAKASRSSGNPKAKAKAKSSSSAAEIFEEESPPAEDNEAPLADEKENECGPEEGEEEEEKTEDLEVKMEPQVHLKVQGAHGSGYCIFACTDHKDKCQILEVQLQKIVMYTTLSCREVCDIIMNDDAVKSFVQEYVTHPVKKTDLSALKYVRAQMQVRLLDAVKASGE